MFGDFFRKVTNTVVSLWTEAKNTVRQFSQKVKSKIKDIWGEQTATGASVKGKDKWNNLDGDGGGNERYAKIAAHNKAIEEFQKKVKKQTEKQEAKAQKMYQITYDDILSMLKESNINVEEIEKYIEKGKKAFIHVMRNYVNSKVSPADKEWKALVEDIDATDSDLKIYTDGVYKNANNLLLDKLSDACENTNEYIEKCVDKFLKDKERALQIKKESLINLTKDKDSKMKELQKIMEEYASMAFIQYEAEKEI